MKLIRIFCVLVFLVGISLFGWSVLKPDTIEAPPAELNAVSGMPAPPEELGWIDVDQDGMPYHLYICGTCEPDEDGNVDVWFYNPDDNNALLLLNVYQDNKLLCQTGFLKPGEYLQTIQLSSVPDPETMIQYQVVGYEPETYYSLGNVMMTTEVS